MLWDLRRGDSRQAATAAGAHSKRYEFPERLFTLLELAVVHRERSFFFGRARGVQGRNCSGIGNDVAQWKRTGQKGLCAFATDAGGVRKRNCSGIGKDVRRERTGEERCT